MSGSSIEDIWIGSMAHSTIKQQLQKFDFLRYKVAPQVRRLKMRWDKLCADRATFTYITDLKTIASMRDWSYCMATPAVIQHVVPSKTIPETALEMVHQIEQWVKTHNRRNEGTEHLYTLWYAHLISMMRYPVEETFTCLIPDVFISSPRGEVITDTFEAVVQSSRLDWDDVFINSVPNRKQCLPGTYVSLLAKNGHNYGHWMIDILPRTSLVPDKMDTIRYVVPTTFPAYKQESLALLGITPDQIVQVSPGWHRLEQILVCHAAQRSLRPHYEHIVTMVERLRKAVFGTEPYPPPGKKVYISRGKARRQIVNEKAILPVLRAYGFETVFCEELSICDQIRLFAETRYLLGAHGSGLNNSILCPPGGTMIELYNPIRWNYCVRGMASLMGLEHWFLFGENVSVDFDMTVDPKRLEKLLAYIFGVGDFIEPIY